MSIIFTISFLIAFISSLILSRLMIYVGERFGVVDRPEVAPDRKIHKQPTSLLGGVGIFLALIIAITLTYSHVNFPLFLPFGILFLSGFVLIVGGLLDDVYNFKPLNQLAFTILAVVIVVSGGVMIRFVGLPFGPNIWHFDTIILLGLPVASLLFTFIWILGTTYTTKLLDGLDGLVAGLTVISSLTLFAISLSQDVSRLDVAWLSMIVAGAFLGFLIWNWNPAKIFLGGGGSILAGFTLGILSILAGGKIVTVLMIMGIPILDVAWVIWRRWQKEKKSPFTTADRKHLHFRLLDSGLSVKESVLIFYAISLIFGIIAWWLRGWAKISTLIVVFIVMLVLALYVTRRKVD